MLLYIRVVLLLKTADVLVYNYTSYLGFLDQCHILNVVVMTEIQLGGTTIALNDFPSFGIFQIHGSKKRQNHPFFLKVISH